MKRIKNNTLPTENQVLGGGLLNNKEINPELKRYDKNKKQKRIIVSSIIGILLVVGTIILYRTYAFYEEKKEFNVIKGQVPEFSHEDVQLSWYIGDEKQTGAFPTKDSEYVGTSVTCEKGASAEWSNAIWGLVNINPNNQKKVYCSVIFESGDTIANNDVKTTNVKCNSTVFGVSGTCTLYEKVASESLGTDKANGISYSAISSDTNGKGVYLAANEPGLVYFYRGEVDNNHVLFNNICWRIVRTTSTGGVKLIYDGVPNSGKCNNTGAATQLDSTGSAFNSNGKPEYVGWKYTEGEYHGTDNPSTIYSAVSTWYTNNIASVQSKLESTTWCNDRRAYSANTAIPGETGTMTYNASSTTSYAPIIRAYTLKRPSLECPNSNDQFPGYYGLITSDEVMYAGGVFGTENTSYYLYTGKLYWTLSPDYFASGDARVMRVTENGALYSYYYVDVKRGVRPMVSLASSAMVSSGDGSSDKPYIIN